MEKRFLFYLLVGITSVLWVVFFWYSIRYDPNTEFLYPVQDGNWIVHPTQKLLRRVGTPVSRDVVFRRKFYLTHPPANCQVKVTAMTQFIITVNGQFVGDSNNFKNQNWKNSIHFDIAPQLHQGENVVDVEVQNSMGFPSLLFQGNTGRQGHSLSSDLAWEVSYIDTKDWERVRIAGKPQKAKKTVVLSLLLFFFISFIVLSLLPESLKGWLRLSKIFQNQQTHRPRENKFPIESGIYLIFFFLILINILNAVKYPHGKGFDAHGHIEYIKYVALHWHPPLANQGWEMFQPPVFYFLAAVLYQFFGLFTSESVCFKAIQFFSAVSGTGIVVFVYLTLRKLYPQNLSVQLFSVSIGAFLPILLYMNPLVSNEILTGLMISIALYVLICYGFEEYLSLSKSFLLGLFVGIALLTKYTGVCIFLTSFMILLTRMFTNSSMWRKELLNIAIFIFTVFLVSGWFYVRNFVIFDNTFIGNWDEVSGFHYEQPPGYRTLSFYTQFGSVFFEHPYANRFISFWDGIYATLWTDGHGYFVTQPDQIILMRLIIWLAVIPTTAILLGFFQSVKSILKSPYRNPNLAFVLLSLLTLTAIISFSIEVPYYSTIKAFFFLSLTIPISIFAGQGLLTMCERFGRLKVVIYVNLIALYGLIALVFQASN